MLLPGLKRDGNALFLMEDKLFPAGSLHVLKQCFLYLLCT